MIELRVKNIDLNYLSEHGEEIVAKSDIPVGEDILLHIANYDEDLNKVIEKYGKDKLYKELFTGQWDKNNENPAVKEIRLLINIVKKYPQFKNIFKIDIDENEKDFEVISCFDDVLGKFTTDDLIL
ncbi:MAG: hypothetical protein LBR24_01730 [Methanobrevibacter sp.]|jgi:hypothetical protein|nr:hypothetical protein [Methanobrevibacter sp.]